jgi:hypothetical protein
LTSLSVLAITLLIVAAPIHGLLHLSAAVLRRLRKQPWRFDRVILARMALILLPVLAFIATAIFIYFVPREIQDNPVVTRVIIVSFCLMAFGVIAVPIWYLVSGYRRSKERFSLTAYAIAVLALFAMPTVATLAYGISGFTFAMVADNARSANWNSLMGMHDPPFTYQVVQSNCAGTIRGLNGSTPSRPDDQSQSFFSMTEFWFDQTLSGALFDWAEVFKCRLSDYENDPRDVRFSLFVGFYRLFSEAILVSVIIWPFVPLIRRIRRPSPSPSS